MDNKEQGLYEAYTDEQGFSWDEDGDIVAIPEQLKKECEERMKWAMQLVKEGKINAKK